MQDIDTPNHSGGQKPDVGARLIGGFPVKTDSEQMTAESLDPIQQQRMVFSGKRPMAQQGEGALKGVHKTVFRRDVQPPESDLESCDPIMGEAYFLKIRRL